MKSPISIVLFSVLLFSCVFFTSKKIFSQQNTYTLAQAIEFGLKNRQDLKNQNINVAIQENEIQKIKSKYMPKVDASLDIRYNTQLQTSVIPAGVFGADASNVRFGTDFNTLMGVSATYDVYNSNLKSDKKIAFQNIEIEKLNTQKTQIDIKHNITQAYYQVLLNQEKLKFAKENIIRTTQYLQEGETKRSNGTILQTDLDKLKLDNQNAQMTIDEEEKTLALSKEYLANQMGIGQAVEISEDMTFFINQNTQNTILEAKSTANRIEIQQEKARVILYDANIYKQNKSNLPIVSLYGNWNMQNLSNQFEPYNADKWFPFSYVGAKVNFNIFDGFQKKYNKQEYFLKIEQSKNNQIKLQNDFDYELKNALTELKNIDQKLKMAKENISLAQKVLEVDNVRQKEGKITPAELKNTIYALQTSQNNLLVQYYNFLMAKLKYQKAAGEL